MKTDERMTLPETLEAIKTFFGTDRLHTEFVRVALLHRGYALETNSAQALSFLGWHIFSNDYGDEWETDAQHADIKANWLIEYATRKKKLYVSGEDPGYVLVWRTGTTIHVTYHKSLYR